MKEVDGLEYATTREITSRQFVQLLKASTLAERRPVGDAECIDGMLRHTDLLVTAWHGDELVGVARSVTDFAYCCYLSDLAVDVGFQKAGVGKRLMRMTKEQLGPRCKLILLSAPAAHGYYPRVGFDQHPSAWVLHEDRQIE